MVARFFVWCGQFCGLRLGLFVLCAALLCYGLFRPESPPQLFEQSDKLLHVLAFAALALSARLAFGRVPGWLLWGVLLAFAPVAERLQQLWQPARHFSLHDALANVLGVALALLAWWLLGYLRKCATAAA